MTIDPNYQAREQINHLPRRRSQNAEALRAIAITMGVAGLLFCLFFVFILVYLSASGV